jgi:hypothetical protein
VQDGTVRCEDCGATAKVLATEGELFPPDNAKSRIILTIDCPKCGKREQAESPGRDLGA